MPRNTSSPSAKSKEVVKKIGSFRSEDSDASVKAQLRVIQLKLQELERKIKKVDDKIYFVQKVTKDRHGKQIIVVKKR